jgi:phosphotransferase system enzyme I (PtsI)
VRRLTGIAAARGIAFGTAVISDRRRVRTPRRHIKAEEVDGEIQRFCGALEATDKQLQRIKEKLYWAGGQEHTLILQAHQLILKDEQLVEQTKQNITEEKINAEWALRRTIAGIKRLFDRVEDDYFRERRSDVDFVADHLMVTLTGGRQLQEGEVPDDAIIVAHDLSPADTARFWRAGIKAFITEVGGRTSHTSIMARSLAIPAVVGIKEITETIGSGDRLIVDGYRGEVLWTPDHDTVRRYRRRAHRRAEAAAGLRRERELPAETLDGVRVHLLANIELSDEIPSALAHGAEGIGLYRTEFLYLGRDRLPTEEEHLNDARQVIGYCGDAPVTFRTCDLGGDKIPGGGPGHENNPALGLRSIRLCLSQQQMFRDQLRGLVRASSHGNIRIMFPMISGVEEIREARRVLNECVEEVRSEGIQIPRIPVGVMVEMPSAAVMADLLAREADFFSIGTNDLTQYALAIDRVNEHVNYLFRPFHPAILRLIQQVVAAADAASIPVTVCGEMAGDPLMTLVLLGLGVRRLSMSALAVPTIKRVVRCVRAVDACDLAERIVKLGTAEAVEAAVTETMRLVIPDQRLLVGDEIDEDTSS